MVLMSARNPIPIIVSYDRLPYAIVIPGEIRLSLEMLRKITQIFIVALRCLLVIYLAVQNRLNYLFPFFWIGRLHRIFLLHLKKIKSR